MLGGDLESRRVACMRGWGHVQSEPREGGFTLIEMLVVIVIIAILAAVVLLAVGSIKDKGESSTCSEEYRTIQTAEEAYYAKRIGGGTYTDMAGLVSARLLTEASTLYDVASSGSGYDITPLRNNPNRCAVPPA